jgi:starch synthase
MAQSTRILFVGGEVEPFAKMSTTARLMRALPEQLYDAGGYDVRLMIPRYGSISERKHSLHKVIRLSGTDVPMGDATETLTVKVASVPDTRLQVYFMDHDGYFGRDGIAHDANGEAFADNARRAQFFSRAVLETLRTLRWGPDIIHAFGWMGGMLPMLLSTEYVDDDVLQNTKVVYTPDDLNIDAALPEPLMATVDGAGSDALPTLTETGLRYADASIYPPAVSPVGEALQFSDGMDDCMSQALPVYNQMLSEVPA